jgi:hypothetical protein
MSQRRRGHIRNNSGRASAYGIGSERVDPYRRKRRLPTEYSWDASSKRTIYGFVLNEKKDLNIR